MEEKLLGIETQVSPYRLMLVLLAARLLWILMVVGELMGVEHSQERTHLRWTGLHVMQLVGLPSLWYTPNLLKEF